MKCMCCKRTSLEPLVQTGSRVFPEACVSCHELLFVEASADTYATLARFGIDRGTTVEGLRKSGVLPAHAAPYTFPQT